MTNHKHIKINFPDSLLVNHSDHSFGFFGEDSINSTTCSGNCSTDYENDDFSLSFNDSFVDNTLNSSTESTTYPTQRLTFHNTTFAPDGINEEDTNGLSKNSTYDVEELSESTTPQTASSTTIDYGLVPLDERGCIKFVCRRRYFLASSSANKPGSKEAIVIARSDHTGLESL